MNAIVKNPVGKLRARQKAETYALILDCARALFDELGFEKTTIRAVATRAEIGLGTVYKYFSQKNAMLAAAFHDDIQATMIKAFRSLSKKQSLKQKLLHLAMHYFTFYAARPALSRTYLTQLFQFDEKWMAKISQIDEVFLTKVARLVADAQKNGEVKKNADTRLVAAGFFSHYLYVLGSHMSRNTFQAGSMTGMLEGLVDLLLSGIQTTATK